jgi:hypothetical protein
MEYIVEIRAGVESLKKFEDLVEAEENTSAKFVKVSISYHEGTITNLVTFKELDGEFVKKLTFIEGKPPASDNVVPEWAGVLLIKGKATVAVALRS